MDLSMDDLDDGWSHPSYSIWIATDLFSESEQMQQIQL